MIRELRALLDEASPRPWGTDNGVIFSRPGGLPPTLGWLHDPADAALIVAAVAMLPGLLAVAEAAKTVGRAGAGPGLDSALCRLAEEVALLGATT